MYARTFPVVSYCVFRFGFPTESFLYISNLSRVYYLPFMCPSLGTRAKYMTLSRIQSRAVTGLLTGYNTLRRHLYLLGLSNSPLCRWCEAGEETSAHVLCECEALASRRHTYLGSFLEPGDIKNLNFGAIWNCSKAAGIPWFDMGHKGPVLFKA